jgi:hypothetical protein
MSESITDANDCYVKVGSSKGGTPDGRLIITDFQVDRNKNRTRKYGLGNDEAQGRTNGNKETDLSFTHEGENNDLLDDIEAGNFSVVLTSRQNKWTLDNVDGSYTLNVGDEEFTLDFDGDALGFTRQTR